MRTVVFDIDGTLADCKHRLHHILEKPQDWKAFDDLTLADTPITAMIQMNRLVAKDLDLFILVLTGRNERTRADTETWLKRNYVSYNQLEMRGYDDRRPADVLKLERLQSLQLWPDKVITLFEDDPLTTKTLRAAGYHVCCVDDREYVQAAQSGGR